MFPNAECGLTDWTERRFTAEYAEVAEFDQGFLVLILNRNFFMFSSAFSAFSAVHTDCGLIDSN